MLSLRLKTQNLGDHVIKVRVEDQVEKQYLEKDATAHVSESNDKKPLEMNLETNQTTVAMEEATSKLESAKQIVNLKVKVTRR